MTIHSIGNPKRNATRYWTAVFALLVIFSGVYQSNLAFAQPANSENDNSDSKRKQSESPEVIEARARARILHESFHGTLQVMHRDFFREGERQTLPSKSLEDVFSELKRTQQIEMRWLAINANAMSVDHKPQNDFEKEAVKAITAGEKEFESIEPDQFRFVGSIRLSASCLKCHVRNRTSNEPRSAGLVISLPLKKREANEEPSETNASSATR